MLWLSLGGFRLWGLARQGHCRVIYKGTKENIRRGGGGPGSAGGRCMQSAEQKKTYWLPRGSGETGGSRGAQDSLWEEEEGIMQCEGYSEEDGVEHRICS